MIVIASKEGEEAQHQAVPQARRQQDQLRHPRGVQECVYIYIYAHMYSDMYIYIYIHTYVLSLSSLLGRLWS